MLSFDCESSAKKLIGTFYTKLVICLANNAVGMKNKNGGPAGNLNHPPHKWMKFEPGASSMPRKHSSSELPAHTSVNLMFMPCIVSSF